VLRRGGSSVKFSQIGEGRTCFVRSRGRVALFPARKKFQYSLSLLLKSTLLFVNKHVKSLKNYNLYVQAKLLAKINPNVFTDIEKLY